MRFLVKYQAQEKGNKNGSDRFCTATWQITPSGTAGKPYNLPIIPGPLIVLGRGRSKFGHQQCPGSQRVDFFRQTSSGAGREGRMEGADIVWRVMCRLDFMFGHGVFSSVGRR
jgi:hypothetical protein